MKRVAVVYAAIATPLIALTVWLALQHRALAEAQSSEAGQRPYVIPPGAGKISSPGEWKFVKSQGNGSYSMVEINVKELPRLPHGYRVTKVPARYLLMFTPAGIEPLFAEVAELRKRFPNQDGAYREELEKIQAKYGARPATGWHRPSEVAPR